MELSQETKVRYAVVLACTVMAAGLWGCGGGNTTQVDAQGLVGDWVEFVPEAPAQGPRVAAMPRPKQLRSVTFAADNTFTMQVTDLSGKPIPGATVSGQWTKLDRYVELKITENNLEGPLAELTPNACDGVYSENGEDRTILYDDAGNAGVFRRK